MKMVFGRNITDARLLSLKYCSHLNNCSYYGNCMTFGNADDAFCHCYPSNSDDTCAQIGTLPPIVIGKTSALIMDSPQPCVLVAIILLACSILALCLVWLVYSRKRKTPDEGHTLKGVSIALKSVDDV